MNFSLTTGQEEAQATYRAFVDEFILPHAGEWDRREALPEEIFQQLGARRYMVPTLPEKFGGTRDGHAARWPLLGASRARLSIGAKSVGRARDGGACAPALRQPRSERTLAAKNRERRNCGCLRAHRTGHRQRCQKRNHCGNAPWQLLRIERRKKWISFGMRASIFLVIAQSSGGASAFLVERGTPAFLPCP